MFQNLTNYLLGAVMGGPTAANPQEELNIGTTAAAVENTNGAYSPLRATEDHEEGEWVLVDRDSEGNSDAGSLSDLEDFAGCLDDDKELHATSLASTSTASKALKPKARTRSSSTSSLPSCTAMEESWFVTPPPCFTSAGPVQIETSPLENLLIEHPSMSVYHIHQLGGSLNGTASTGRRHQLATATVIRTASMSPRRPASVVEDLFDVEDVEVIERRPVEVEAAVVVVNDEGQVAVAVVPRPRLNRLQALQQQERQIGQCRRAQKVQRQRQYQCLKKNALERNDKAREVNGRNRRQRRGERSQGATRSYANNNRKC